MEKLQWFKFNYADWRMGKIQRCPEITQARFLNLCCLYWSKECVLSLEDAEIEIDKEHLDVLIQKKIVEVDKDNISIKFLDEQRAEIDNTKKEKSNSGKLGNLKRWHKSLYDNVVSGKLSLEDALTIADQSHTDSTPIAKGRREEEIRKEKNINIPFLDFWNLYDKKVGGKTKPEKKWNSLKDEERVKIMETLPAFKDLISEKRYQPNPLTYLNNERWLDEIEKPKPKRASGGAFIDHLC